MWFRLFLLFLASSMALAQDWPRFRGPNGDGTWNPADLPADLSHLHPRQLWKQEVGGGYGGVTVAAHRVYVMDRSTEGDEVERILCFDEETGKLLWQHNYPVSYKELPYGSGPRASVTIHEGRAYAFGAMGMVTCLDAVTGELRWQRDTVQRYGAVVPTWGFAASPFIWKDKVLIHCGARPKGTIIALDLATGTERWRAGDDPAGYCTPTVVENQGHSQLIQWSPESILSFDPETGTTLWRIPHKITYGVSIAQPIYKENLLFISSYWHGARAIRLGPTPQDAKLNWSEEKTLRGLMSQPLYRAGMLFMLDRNDGVIAFKLRTGEIQWKDNHQLTLKNQNPQMSMVWANEKASIACCLNASGELIFVRFGPDRMDEFSRHPIIEKTWAHPAFAGRRVFARSDKSLVAWELW